MNRFVILATPRCGSNWLCSLLDSHPEILCHHELFNPEGIHLALSQRQGDLNLGDTRQRDLAPLKLLARAWQEDLGHKAVGFKLNRGQSALIQSKVLRDPGIRKIVIRRENRIRSYVSECIAEASGEWESYQGLKISAVSRPIAVDPGALLRHAAANRAYYDSIGAELARTGQEAFAVSYERLAEPEVRRALLCFLEVLPDIALRSGTRRQNPAPLRDLISNFDELALALGDTDLLDELTEGSAG